MQTKILEELGLTKQEIKVYLSMLELGLTPAGPLIKKLGMHRATVYNLLDLLIDKGLISYTNIDNRKYFKANNPKRLLEFLESKKQNLENKKIELKKLIPLLKRKTKPEETQEGTIYKGKKGLKSIFHDILTQKKEWLIFGATGKFKEHFPIYFKHFHNSRTKKKIPMKIIYNKQIKQQKRDKELKNAQIKYVLKEYLTPSTTYVYGNRVAIITWSNKPMAFLIISEEIAQSYKNFFNTLWSSAKK
jgi:HTH-type transcriptional regulator, sugar sensing transcriptional regulator